MRRRLALQPLALACVPAAAMLAVSAFADGGARGLFQADAAALAATAALAAFAAKRDARRVGVLALALAPAALVHLLLGGAASSLPAFASLLLGIGAAAAGLALLGRRFGAPAISAGVLATAVPVVAMLGLFWADPLAEALPRAKRYAFKQAVIHADAASAVAYGVADFDRFHHPRIYADVPLATEPVRPPEAVPTGLLWLAVGLLSGLGACLRRGREPA